MSTLDGNFSRGSDLKVSRGRVQVGVVASTVQVGGMDIVIESLIGAASA